MNWPWKHDEELQGMTDIERMKQMQIALKQILELADAHDEHSPEATLEQIGHLAAGALTL